MQAQNRIVNARRLRRLGLRSARSFASLAPTPHSATVCQPRSCYASPYPGWQTVVYNRERYAKLPLDIIWNI